MIRSLSGTFALIAFVTIVAMDYVNQSHVAGLRPGQLGFNAYALTLNQRFVPGSGAASPAVPAGATRMPGQAAGLLAGLLSHLPGHAAQPAETETPAEQQRKTVRVNSIGSGSCNSGAAGKRCSIGGSD